LDDLEKGIEEEHIERLFVPMVKPVANGFANIVRICMEKKVKLKVISHESEELLRFSRVKDIAGISLYSPPKLLTNELKARVKRVFDVCGSSFLLVLFSPLIALAAVAILIEDGRPVLFRQRRASMKGGRTFEFLKFRSMIKDAEAEQEVMNGLNQTEGGLFLLKGDPRVTRVGRWFRKFSIDELPQLLNVLKGEMSLVGPRPLSMIDLESASPDHDFAGYYYLRDNTRPGITGLWQICGRRDVPFREMVLLDLYYIENQSIIFDLEILFATIPVVLFGRGAY
jgi:lipopolysaccharide/colanic/teichoic acid biosynthesis glycosyltransferase